MKKIDIIGDIFQLIGIGVTCIPLYENWKMVNSVGGTGPFIVTLILLVCPLICLILKKITKRMSLKAVCMFVASAFSLITTFSILAFTRADSQVHYLPYFGEILSLVCFIALLLLGIISLKNMKNNT